MAATGYTPIILYYSTTAAAAPTAGNLANGELAINITDGKLYYKDNSGVVQLIASKSGASGSVTSVAQSFTGGLISVSGSPITTSGTLALTVAGTSGGIPYFSSASAWASSAALTANALMIGGGAGAAPATTTTGTGVLTALGVNIGTAGAFVVNGGALGTPSSGTVTNLTGTASININGTVGATTPSTGAFTTGSFSGVVSFAAGTVSAPSIYLSTDTATGFYRIGANNYGFAVSGSKVLDIASTGLSVTGALSATGLITKTNSAATQSQFLAVSGSTTAATYADITNTTGALRIGIESSAGGILATGTSAYASVISSNSATALQLCGGGIIGVSIASTGITTIPKRLVVTGSDNATLASFTNSNNSGNVVGDFINSAATSTNQYGVRATLSGDPNSTGTYFFNCLGNITERGTWRGNGGIANYQANDVNLSDMSIKTDFHAYDSNMIWDFGKRMKGAWGRFKYDDQTHDDWNNGYGAQLVRDAAGSDFPELVEETDWRGKGNVLTVYDSDLMHIMGAVTTEAQHRIEEQEARIARLEAALAKAGISLQ